MFRVTTALAILLLAVTATSADWYSAAGGNSQRTGYVDCVGPDEPNRLWEGSIFTRYVRPIVVTDGRIYAPWNQSGSGYNLVVAMDLQTGDELWSVELPTDGSNPASNRSRVSAVRDGQAYLSRGGNNLNPLPLYAHDAVTGDFIWQSEVPISEYGGQSAVFAPDGDIIVPTGHSPNDFLSRIDKDDGSLVWSTPIDPPTSDAIGAVVLGDKVYSWDWPTHCTVSVFDLATGTYLYSGPNLVGSGAGVQHGLFVGLDGKIYAPHASGPGMPNFLYALEDTGSSLDIVWTYPSGYGWSSTFGVGPEGSIYSHDEEGHMLRLDSTDGSLIARSLAPIPGHGVGPWYDWSPRLAVDNEGKVFVTNGSFEAGTVSAYDSGMNLLWTEDVGTMSITGPALASTGQLVVQTRFDGMIVYCDATGVVDSGWTGSMLLSSAPNPFRRSTTFQFSLNEAGTVQLDIYDLRGRRVRTLLASARDAGRHRIVWNGEDDRGNSLASGTYLSRLSAGDFTESGKLVLLR